MQQNDTIVNYALSNHDPRMSFFIAMT